ncbi:MAG: endonuclease/exonuclease/phosphatase family protein [Bacteroidia bacterium]|nr:endonuclease/exonuclease/phosphatase family protein [Bacteroidia bacterium]MDW8302202.1 endonuclease/exonuclease/phosphatase family protein [Bacteroidia bacterium]
MARKKWLCFVAHFIYASVSILVAFSYVSQYISPLQGSIFYLFSLVVWYIQLGAWIILIWAALQKQTTWMLVFLLLQVVGIRNYRVTYAFRFSEKTVDQALKVVTYNVKNFELGTEALLEEIAAQQADIVCLQEVWDYKRIYNSTYNFPNPLQYLQRSAHLPYLFFYPRIQENFGLAILSKYPIIQKGTIPFKSNGINGMMYVDIIYKNTKLRVYNVHLQSINLMYNPKYEHEIGKIKYDTPDKRRYLLQQLIKSSIKRTYQLELLLQSIRSCQHPVVVAGDFNSTPYSHLYWKMTRDLQDNFIMSGKGLGYTFDKYPLRIDYIFSDRRLKPAQTFTYKTPYSDHSMVVSYMYLV